MLKFLTSHSTPLPLGQLRRCLALRRKIAPLPFAKLVRAEGQLAHLILGCGLIPCLLQVQRTAFQCCPLLQLCGTEVDGGRDFLRLDIGLKRADVLRSGGLSKLLHGVQILGTITGLSFRLLSKQLGIQRPQGTGLLTRQIAVASTTNRGRRQPSGRQFVFQLAPFCAILCAQLGLPCGP